MAREGNHLMTPFECDLCIFIKLKGRFLISQSDEDKKLASYIRRVNLDYLWSRAPTTVTNNLRLANNFVNLPNVVRLKSPFISNGTFPGSDNCGYQIAISMILMSTKPRRYDKSYAHFDAIRHLTSCFNKYERASIKNKVSGFKSTQGNNQENHDNITSTVWFRLIMMVVKLGWVK